MSGLLDIARAHAQRGYPVFPLRPRAKTPSIPRGFHAATVDERAILQWWDRSPDGNVGIYPGGVGAFILDIDPKEGADPEDVLTDLELDIADLVIVWTGAAPERSEKYPDSLPGVIGAHVYFAGKQPTAQTARKGVEVRGVGGYGLAPGSVHPCGRRYTGELPPVAALGPAPPQVLELLAKPTSNGAGAGEAPPVEHVPPGGMHAYLTDLAVRLARAGQRDVHVVEAALIGAFEAKRVPGAVYAGGARDTRRLAEWAVESEIAQREAGVDGEDGQGAGSKKKEKESKATQLVKLALGAGVELFHTPEGEAFATVPVDGRRETWPLKTKTVRRWLDRLFYLATESTAGAQAVQDAISVLEGKALFDGVEHAVHMRVAEHGGAIYLDLADAEWRAVEITKGGWRVIVDPPVRFRRARGMLPLPTPVAGGAVDGLRTFLNFANEDDFRLMVAWLVMAFRPRGPYPVLALHGEQGSGKSTVEEALRKLIDPNEALLRPPPRDERDLVIAGSNGRIIALENLSVVQPWLSDALCRIATGSGFGTRELYTDADEAIFSVQLPIALNGIVEVVIAGDLQDRSIVLMLPTISEYTSEDDLWDAFESARPRLLGALLDVVASALATEPAIDLDEYPRMADFARWTAAACPALGWDAGEVLKAYAENRAMANETTLDASPLVAPLRRVGQFEGSATDLLAKLAEDVGPGAAQAKEWPKSPAALSGSLRRLAPNLRRALPPLSIEFDREGGTGQRVIRVKP